MGFRPPRGTIALTFAADTDYAGMEVVMRTMSVGAMLRFREVYVPGARATAALPEIVDMAAKHLASWNLVDDDDQPLPLSAESLLAQDMEFITAFVNAWGDGMTGVSAPLEPGSQPGEPQAELEASIPTETLPVSQES